MESVGISHLAGRHVRELSGGEKVLAALAAAMVSEPRVLILDEYDSHLDSIRISDVDKILKKLQVPYIIRCTQDMDTAGNSDHILFFRNGKNEYSGPPSSVFLQLKTTPFYPLSWRCGYTAGT